MNLVVNDTSTITIDITIIPNKGDIAWPVVEPKHHKLIDIRSLKYWAMPRPYLLGPMGFRDIVTRHLDLCKLYAPLVTNLVPHLSKFTTSIIMRKFLRAIEVLDRCVVVYNELEAAAAVSKPLPYIHLKQLCPDPDFVEVLPGFSEAKIKALKKQNVLSTSSTLFEYRKKAPILGSKPRVRFVCHLCHQPGHIKKHCPKNTK